MYLHPRLASTIVLDGTLSIWEGVKANIAPTTDIRLSRAVAVLHLGENLVE